MMNWQESPVIGDSLTGVTVTEVTRYRARRAVNATTTVACMGLHESVEAAQRCYGCAINGGTIHSEGWFEVAGTDEAGQRVTALVDQIETEAGEGERFQVLRLPHGYASWLRNGSHATRMEYHERRPSLARLRDGMPVTA